MSVRRYIGTLRKEGSPDEFIPHASHSLESARRFFAEIAAESWPGWEVVSVKPETDTHCIPVLDPVRWKASEEALAASMRRIR